MGRRIVDDALDRGRIGHIHFPAFDIVKAGILDFLDHDIDVALAQVGDGDIGAFTREQVRGGPAHAAGGAGDEGGLAFDRTGKFLIGGLAHVFGFLSLMVPEKLRTGRSLAVTIPRTKVIDRPWRSTSPRASISSPSRAPSRNSDVNATVRP